MTEIAVYSLTAVGVGALAYTVYQLWWANSPTNPDSPISPDLRVTDLNHENKVVSYRYNGSSYTLRLHDLKNTETKTLPNGIKARRMDNNLWLYSPEGQTEVMEFLTPSTFTM